MDRIGAEDRLGGVGHLAGLLLGPLGDLPLGLGSGRTVVVVGVQTGDLQSAELHRLEGATVLHAALGADRPLAQDHVVALQDRREVIEHDLVELRVALEGEVRLGQEVGAAVDQDLAAVEHGRLDADARRILDVEVFQRSEHLLTHAIAIGQHVGQGRPGCRGLRMRVAATRIVDVGIDAALEHLVERRVEDGRPTTARQRWLKANAGRCPI